MTRGSVWLGGFFALTAAAWGLGITEHERPLIERSAERNRLVRLEHASAEARASRATLLELAEGYLDARQPGMAIATIERASPELRTVAEVEHLYARALVAAGRATEALMAERRALSACARAPGTDACSASLQASSARRIALLETLQGFGVEDAPMNPKATQLAYVVATRPVAVAVASQ